MLMKIVHMVKSYFFLKQQHNIYIYIFNIIYISHTHPDWEVVINPLAMIPGFQDSHYDTDGHKSYNMFWPMYTHGKG